MELIEGIEEMRSIRAFKPALVARHVLESIIKTAQRSPSYKNTQPWEVIVVCSEKKDKLSMILVELAEKDTPANPDIPLPPPWPEELKRRLTESMIRRTEHLGIDISGIVKSFL